MQLHQCLQSRTTCLMQVVIIATMKWQEFGALLVALQGTAVPDLSYAGSLSRL